MNTQKEISDAELERLLAEVPVPGRLSRRALISQLEQVFARVQKQTTEMAAAIKKEGADSPKFSELMNEIQLLSAKQLKLTRRLERLKNPQTGITCIVVENFKGIGPEVTIPLRPITLLFGANSAGKSTIVQALHYARELLERNNANPDRTLTGGEAIEMGGFRNLVHKHDLGKEIRIRIEMTPSADGVPSLDELLGTASQERQVRVSAERIRRTLAELGHRGRSFSADQQQVLWSSLRRRLEPFWSSVFERADRSKDIYEQRLRETLERLLISMPPLEWQRFFVRALDAKPDEKGQISFKADELKKLLAQLPGPQRAGEQGKQELRDRLFKELLKVWTETSETELSSMKSNYRERLTSEFQQALDSAVRSSFRPESESGWQQLTDYLMRSVESSGALDINQHIETVALELVARWDFETQQGWFSECRYFLDGRQIITIRKPKPDAWPSIETIDYFHPVMLAMDESLKEEQEQYGQELAEQMAELDGDLKHRLLRKNASPTLGFAVIRPSTGAVLVDKDQRLTPALIKQVVEALPDVACLSAGADELIPQAREEIEIAIRRFQERDIQLRKRLEFHPFIQLADATNVAPDSNRALPFRASDLGESREHFVDVINQIVVGITALARQHLQQFRYIGPIRAIPDRNHEAPQIEDPTRWSSGLAAWDLLLRQNTKDEKNEKGLVESVSDWMEKPDRLSLGYRIEVSEVKPLPEDSLLMNHLALLQSRYDEKSQHEFRETIWKPLQNLPHIRRIRIIDTRTKTEVAPKDIGMGVAQVIPIVVAALDPKCRMLSVEQPELHLHPRVACDLADLFISGIGQDKLFLIETHSEHLLLRLMRRIRENVANQLPKSQFQIQAADVAILFVEHAKAHPQEHYEARTIVREMPLNERGDLIKAWPNGFFEEDLNEVL